MHSTYCLLTILFPNGQLKYDDCPYIKELKLQYFDKMYALRIVLVKIFINSLRREENKKNYHFVCIPKIVEIMFLVYSLKGVIYLHL